MTRVEVLISSNEEAYRRKHYPTIEERLEKQRDWARIQLREAKMASERAALKTAMELKTIAARRRMEAVEDARRDGLPIPHEPESDEIDPMIPEEPAGPGGAPLPDGEEAEDGNMAEQAMNDEFAAELLDIKERKLLATRKTLQYHKEMTRWEKRKLSWKVHYGWMGKRDKDLTVVLPWLLLGRREVSSNQSLLLQMGVTHILNMTHDCPCVFPHTFVYQRVPIRDNITTDLAAHFTTIINFIKRAEKCKGRVSSLSSVPFTCGPIHLYFPFHTNVCRSWSTARWGPRAHLLRCWRTSCTRKVFHWWMPTAISVCCDR